MYHGDHRNQGQRGHHSDSRSLCTVLNDIKDLLERTSVEPQTVLSLCTLKSSYIMLYGLNQMADTGLGEKAGQTNTYTYVRYII
jgi:hypothetical protein